MNITCANCGIEINWQPTVVDGQVYCCLGCARGGPCTCDYSSLPRVGEFRAVVCVTRVIHLPPRGRRDSRAADRDGDRPDSQETGTQRN
jgi:hypothetical protein